MTDDLVTRLRDAVNGEHDMTPHGADCLQAAARRAHQAWLDADKLATERLRQLVEAEAKVAALVEAMREIWEYCQNSGRGSELVDDRIIERCEETARAAIAAAKGGDNGLV